MIGVKPLDIIIHNKNNKMTLLRRLIAVVGLLLISIPSFSQYTQDPLPYAYDALEPYIDSQTMEIHYSKHHAGYVAKLNKAFEDSANKNTPLQYIFQNISKYSVAVRNNAGGHFNHTLFWSILTPQVDTQPDDFLMEQIDISFGGMAEMVKQLNAAASTRFGSGWAWLIVTSEGKLAVTSTPNQDNPLMADAEMKGKPILGIDVWEHAYYLKYQNRRGDYLAAIWNVINWDEVSKRNKLVRRDGKYVFANWSEFNALHDVMKAVYHPSQKGDVGPVKSQIKDLVKLSKAVEKAGPPELFNNENVVAATKKYVEAVNEFNKKFKRKSDEEIISELETVHTLFHDVMMACRLH